MSEVVADLFERSRMLWKLRKTDSKLSDFVVASCHSVLPVLQQIPDAFGEYTDHGVRHSISVFNLGESLLGEVSLQPWEAAIFLLSSFYHDVGMACPKETWEVLEATEDFRRELPLIRAFVLPRIQMLSENPEAIRVQTITEYLRRHHGELGRRWILANRSQNHEGNLVHGVYLWDQVARVSVGHTLEVTAIEVDGMYRRRSPLGTAVAVDTLLLTCLLRLGDICHLSRDRALPHVRRSRSFTSGLSQAIWETHEDIAGVAVDPERSVIVVRAEPQNFERHRAIHEEVEAIRRELANSHRLLAGHDRSLPWKFVESLVHPAPGASYEFVERGKFRLVEDKIVNLLMGSRLYAEQLYAIRECVQNSLDAISVVRLEQPRYGGIVFLGLSSSPDGRVLDVIDNGVGMDQQIVLDHLLSAGSQPFFQSERRARDWGDFSTESSFIARHGIGFLSVFMLAREVEVFSRYRGSSPVYLRIDSPTRNVEFLRANGMDGFPSWPLDRPTPWQTGHGTCIRIHLSESVEVSAPELVVFAAENLPRLPVELAIAREGEVVRAEEIWRRHTALWPLPDGATLQEIANRLFNGERASNRYLGGPPHDRSLERGMVRVVGLRGFSNVSHGSDRLHRVTQDGILIREGAEALWSQGRGGLLRECPFDFDIDLTAPLQLELDAERARVVHSEWNVDRCREICDDIEREGLASLAEVESALFFSCGGSYYHGGVDFLAGHSGPSFAFHLQLRTWYGLERFRQTADKFGPEAFFEAKLYTFLGEAHNTAVSVSELGLENRLLLTLGERWNVELADEGGVDVRRGTRGGSRLASLVNELESVADLENLLIVPNASDFFALPLLCWYDVASETQIGRSKALLLKLDRKERWALPTQDELERVSASLPSRRRGSRQSRG